MKPADYVRGIKEDAARLRADLPAAVDEATPGIRARAYDGDVVSSGQGPADPTASFALQRPDRATWHKKRLDELLPRIRRDMDELLRMQTEYDPPPVGSKARMIAANEPVCVLCRRAGRDGQSVYVTTMFATIEGPGLPLPERTAVCLSHYDMTRRLGRRTTTAEDEHYARLLEWPKGVRA